MRAEINELGNRKTIEKTVKPKVGCRKKQGKW